MNKRRGLAALGAAVMLSGCVYSEESGLSLVFADTGKSDFLLIQAEGCTVVNDAAYLESYPEVSELMNSRGVSHIDLLILSHFDKDHIGGAADILRDFEVERVVMPDYFGGSEYWLELMDALGESGTEQVVLSEDAEFTLGEVSFHISAPKLSDYDDKNDFSLITEVAFGETRFLLTGDARDARLGEFLADSPAEHYDLIKMPHHGSYSSALGRLVSQTSPDFAVITADADRETVDKKTLKALEECETVFTDEGTAVFFSDGKTLTKLP